MLNSFYSTLLEKLEKGDVERHTIFSSSSTFLYQNGKIIASCGEREGDERDLVEIIKPEPHLVIFGGGHVSKAIADISSILNMKVTIVEERKEMANRDRFTHEEELIVEPYSSFLAKDHDFFRPYYIIVTHGHSYDSECLEWCLKRNYSYLGMIGSKAKVAATFSKMEEKGFSKEKIESVHAPIGLKIGAVTPEEIAISILSEVISVFRSTKNTITIDPRFIKQVSQDKGISARIVEKRGSAPRAVGSEIFISESGRVYGTVGGGSIEKNTIEEARRMLESGEKTKLIHYNLSAKGDLGMICGGDVTMLFTKVEAS